MMMLLSGHGLKHCDAGGVSDWIAGDVWGFSHESVGMDFALRIILRLSGLFQGENERCKRDATGCF